MPPAGICTPWKRRQQVPFSSQVERPPDEKPLSIPRLQVVHDYGRSMRLYPQLAAELHGNHAARIQAATNSSTQRTYSPGPGLLGSYVAELSFMQQYQKYQFLFTVQPLAARAGAGCRLCWVHDFDTAAGRRPSYQAETSLGQTGWWRPVVLPCLSV